jgi:DNA-binding IclR family transcriptional regulator
VRTCAKAGLRRLTLNQKLSFAGKQIITYLASSNEPAGLVEIAAGTGLSYSTVSVQVRVLIAQGVVQRLTAKRAGAFRLTAASSEAK